MKNGVKNCSFLKKMGAVVVFQTPLVRQAKNENIFSDYALQEGKLNPQNILICNRKITQQIMDFKVKTRTSFVLIFIDT
jgi:hypothetical protein